MEKKTWNIKMKDAFITTYDCITPLGDNKDKTFNQIIKGKSGIQYKKDWGNISAFTREQQINIFSTHFTNEKPICYIKVKTILKRFSVENNIDLKDKNIGVIICSTKGDIHLLSITNTTPLVNLSLQIKQDFNLFNDPIILSNACISSLHGLILSKRYIQSNLFKKVIVIGVDLVSTFVRDGFTSLMAISNEPFAPFDINRNGINLGEAVAIALIEDTPNRNSSIQIINGAVRNDANHITGPSREGVGLINALEHTLKDLSFEKLKNKTFISPHGTGTIYNDEMESKSFYKLKLNEFPAIAYKGYFGHTLGTVGILESIMGFETLRTGILPTTKGYEKCGVSYQLNFNSTTSEPTLNNFNYFIKTCSGFGGCNAAIIFSKIK
jgi:3-oxoacyl-[acyl-carrier-protein] synthase-1